MPTNLRGMITAARITLDDLGVRKVSEPLMLNAANEGKNELVKIIRQARENFFETTTTGTIAAVSAPNPSTITLPDDFSELRELVITNSGFEDIGFIKANQSDPRFRAALIDGGSFGNGSGMFYYDFLGLSTLILAPGADIALAYKMSYIQTVPDMALPTDAPTLIPADHYDFIVTWMVTEAMRKVEDARLQTYLDKLGAQKDSVVASVNVRQIREPVFVRGFMEDDGGW